MSLTHWARAVLRCRSVSRDVADGQAKGSFARLVAWIRAARWDQAIPECIRCWSDGPVPPAPGIYELRRPRMRGLDSDSERSMLIEETPAGGCSRVAS